MANYYKVYLKYENFCILCKRVPFTKDLYREVITDKIIYPQNKNTSDKLTYEYLPNGVPRCYKITNSEVKEWLLKLNAEDYIYNIERFEYITRTSHKFGIDENKVCKKMEKQAEKTIKKHYVKK